MAATTIPAGFHALPVAITQLCLAAVLKCGQSFRWTALPLAGGPTACDDPDVEYRLALRDRVVCLRQTRDALLYRAVFPDGPASPAPSPAMRDAETLAWLRDYFQLDVDLVGLYDTWEGRDPFFGKLRERFTGIRMLRQDPWENLVSFICSQNNHIGRITSMIQSLCTRFSPCLVSIPHPSAPSSFLDAAPRELLTYHAFPPPALLASEETSAVLRSLGFGYRAEYLQRTAQMLVDAHGEQAEAFLGRLRHRPTSEAREELLKFVGVGRKVADCVLLMSLDKHEVVPVDTHVHQIALRHYGLRGADSRGKATLTPRLYDEVQTKLGSVWGDYAGWAHSVLFTADLKSFATYGLPTPLPSVSPDKRHAKGKGKGKGKAHIALWTPDSGVGPVRSTKRKHAGEVESDVVAERLCALTGADCDGDLADRIKRRRRSVR